MELNINGKLPRFYQWNYYSLPNDFCTYFWKLLFALILFPITWWSYPAQKPDFSDRIIAGIISWGAFIVVAYGISEMIEYPVYFYRTLWILLFVIAGLICIFAALAAGAGVLYLYVKYFPDKEDKPSFLSEISQTVKAKKDAVKNNYCPKINWHV